MSDQSIPAHGPVVTEGNPPAHRQDAHGDHAHESHGGNAKYFYVFLALCFLTSLSFLTYSDWWRHHFSTTESRMLMMAVSCTKALLVILCFMHLWWEANWKFVLTIPAAFMSIFLLLMLVPDVGMRLHRASEEKKFYQAEPKPDKSKAFAQPSAAEHAP